MWLTINSLYIIKNIGGNNNKINLAVTNWQKILKIKRIKNHKNKNNPSLLYDFLQNRPILDIINIINSDEIKRRDRKDFSRPEYSAKGFLRINGHKPIGKDIKSKNALFLLRRKKGNNNKLLIDVPLIKLRQAKILIKIILGDNSFTLINKASMK